MKNLKLKTALAAVTLAAASLATPLSAQAQDFRNGQNFRNNNIDCSDTSNTVLGGLAGGVAGAAIGDGIAGRGQSTEIGILGAVIGGIAGAAIGDSASGCENFDRSNVGFTQQAPVYSQQAPVYTQQAPVYTQPTTVYSNPPRTVYTSPRIVTPAPVYNTTTSYSSNRGFNQGQNRLFQIDREIDRLCHEIDYLKAQRRRSRHSSGLKSQIKQLEYRVDDLRRERKQIQKYGSNSRNSYRSY